MSQNFCGDYGNALWGKTDTCDSFTSYETCSEYVGSSPEDFASTYWDVRYIDVYDLGDDKPNPSNWTGTFPDGHGHGDHHDGPHEWLPLPQITYEPLVNPHSIAEYAYVGCFSCASGSTLTLLDECDDMTLDVCVEHCRSAGKGAYAGVHGRECYCGERIDAERNAGAPGTCDKPCPGGPGSFCGGGSGGNGGDVGSKLLSVYGAVKEEHQPAPPPKAAPLASEMANQNYVIPEPDCPETDAAPARQLAPISPTAHGEPLWSPDERKGFGVRPPLPPPVNGSHLFPGEEGQFGGPPRKPVVIVSLAPRGQPPSRLSILMFGAVMAGATLFV